MYVHYDSAGYNVGEVLIATASAPGGPWTQSSITSVDGYNSHDLGLFQDNDGTGYIAYNSGTSGNYSMRIAKLTSNYLGIVAGSSINTGLGQVEAPTLFRRGATYFLLTSNMNGWSPTLNTYATASTPLGTWTNQGNPFQPVVGSSGIGNIPDYTLAYNSQDSNVLQINGNYIYCGTRNQGSNLITSTQVWLPIQFPTPTTMVINWLGGGNTGQWNPSQVFTQPYQYYNFY